MSCIEIAFNRLSAAFCATLLAAANFVVLAHSDVAVPVAPSASFSSGSQAIALEWAGSLAAVPSSSCWVERMVRGAGAPAVVVCLRS
jgi:hypothetical protein